MKRLLLVTFDVTGTLLQFKSSPGKQYAKAGAMFGISSDPETLSFNFKKEWKRMNKDHPNFGRETGRGWQWWWKEIVHNTFRNSVGPDICDIAVLDGISDYLINLYTKPECWTYCKGAFEILGHLKMMDVSLGIISNFDTRLEPILKEMELRDYFQFVLSSYEVGVQKPNREIFDLALKESKIPKIQSSQALHVGDNMELDYRGAINAGWNAKIIYGVNSYEFAHKNNISYSHIFKDLMQLKNCFSEEHFK